MLEYWWQVELFWRLRRGEATGWTVLGDYEYPYWTACSQSKKKLAGPGAEIAATEVLLGPKTGYGACGAKWIDLALASSDKRALLIEMKDLGRAEHRLRKNAFGVGKDLAAIHHTLRAATLRELREPGPSTKDLARRSDFEKVSATLEACSTAYGAVLVMYSKGQIADDEVTKCIRKRYSEWAGLDGEPGNLDSSGPVPAGEFVVQAMTISLPRWSAG
jgi:hypothetical protein